MSDSKGEIVQTKCEFCGEGFEYMILPGYSCPRVQQGGRSSCGKIVPGTHPARVISPTYCPKCNKSLMKQLREETDGAMIIR